ncbi:PREDICTED: microcephalin-like [Priapulus caudatus]|uniref:Microcephalin-like n=1 Tax=Priapulus caudatus TaxID=37621 RepID=A0ABM1F337_PRICU|nr:PREDICTED: microcephalin-like [Priapulus caudatus]
MAIARGCWVVSVAWVLESLESGAWLAETPYECVAWFPAAWLACAEWEAAGGGDRYRQAVFAQCGRVHIGNMDAPEEKMVTLLQQCGAEVTACHRKADVCVGGRTSNVMLKCLNMHFRHFNKFLLKPE